MQWISVVYLPISLSDAQRVAAPSSQWSQHSAAQGRPRTLTHLRLETGKVPQPYIQLNSLAGAAPTKLLPVMVPISVFLG